MFIVLFFIIRLFAVWRYAGRIFNAVSAREGDLRVPQPEGPPPAPPPSWARKEFCVVVCAALLTFVCMMRYSEWNFVPIWFLYSSVLMAIRYADLQSGSGILRYLWWYAVPICDLVLGFFGTYSGTLGRSGPCILRYLW